MKELVYSPAPSSGDGSGAQYYGIVKRENDALKFAFNATYPKRIYQPEDWDSFRKAVEGQEAFSTEPVIVKVR
jgi:hypothetical protein